MRGIRKNFDGTQALKGVDFSARSERCMPSLGKMGREINIDEYSSGAL